MVGTRPGNNVAADGRVRTDRARAAGRFRHGGSHMPTRLSALLVAALMMAALAACGETWRGLKQDTGENLEATGEVIERAGEKVKPAP